MQPVVIGHPTPPLYVQRPELVMPETERRLRHTQWVMHRRQHPPEEPLGLNAPSGPNVYSRKAKPEEVGRKGFSRAPNRGQEGVFFDPRQGDFIHGRAPNHITTTYENKVVGTASSVFTTTGGPDRRAIDPTVMNEATMRAIQKAARSKHRQRHAKDTSNHHSRSVTSHQLPPTTFVYPTAKVNSSSKPHSSYRPSNHSMPHLPSASNGKVTLGGLAKSAVSWMKRL